MTKATRDKLFGFYTAEDGASRPIRGGVAVGSYTYVPAPRHSAAAANGTLTKGGLSVPLLVTEPLFQEFLEGLSRLEADLSRRWVATQGNSAISGAE